MSSDTAARSLDDSPSKRTICPSRLNVPRRDDASLVRLRPSGVSSEWNVHAATNSDRPTASFLTERLQFPSTPWYAAPETFVLSDIWRLRRSLPVQAGLAPPPFSVIFSGRCSSPAAPSRKSPPPALPSAVRRRVFSVRSGG